MPLNKGMLIRVSCLTVVVLRSIGPSPTTTQLQEQFLETRKSLEWQTRVRSSARQSRQRTLYHILRDKEFANGYESAVFNALIAAMTDDHWARQYIDQPNSS